MSAQPQQSSRGFGRPPSRRAGSVSRALRSREGAWLPRRRAIAALSLGAAGSLGMVSLYQFGIVRHLPDPPGRLFDSDRVDAAPEAYWLLATPDGPVGVVSYALTALLAGIHTDDPPERRPWLALGLAAKVGVDALMGLLLTAEQASRHRRFCSWCLLATAATFAMVPLAAPELRAARRGLRQRAHPDATEANRRDNTPG